MLLLLLLMVVVVVVVVVPISLSGRHVNHFSQPAASVSLSRATHSLL